MSGRIVMHLLQEAHADKHCQNCSKQRNGEELDSIFEGNFHYVSWQCSGCGQESWWKTKKMMSNVKHTTLDKKLL